MVTNLRFKDLDALRSFAGTEFPFPDLSCGLYCSQKAMHDEKGKFIGAALLKLTAEAILILDPSASEMSKTRCISDAMRVLPDELDKFGLDQVHVFTLPESDTRWTKFLKAHFGFEDVKGIPLVLTRR